MNRARRALGPAGLLFLLAPGALPFAAEPAIETAVDLPSPERATVRILISAGDGFGGGSGFHGLEGDPERGWERAPMRFRRNPGGGFLFESEIAAGPDGWLRVPIPLPDAPPPAGADLSFAAEITPPPGYRIVDTFPAGAAARNDGRSVRLALPAPPSLLRFRVVAEDARGFGLAAAVDGAVALLLIGLAGFGVRRLFRPEVPDAGGSP